MKKNLELKSPKLHTPGKVGTCHPPIQNTGTSILQTPTSPNHVAEAEARVSSPWQPVSSRPQLSPKPGFYMSSWPTIFSLLVFTPTLRWESLRVEWSAWNNLRCKVLWSPYSAMEAMNQCGQPPKSGKRGPMQPSPLTSGGLALCRSPVASTSKWHQ